MSTELSSLKKPQRALDSDAPYTSIDLARDIEGLRSGTPTASDYVAGLVGAFQGRARAYLVALCAGATQSEASLAARVTPDAVRAWMRDPTYSEAVAACLALALTIPERELWRRALAGDADKGSMRALELLLKARSPVYRDKAGLELTVLHQAQQAQSSWVSGWDES